jgi:hypothetical protein
MKKTDHYCQHPNHENYLKAFLKKYHNDDSWFKIESCKVFANPKILHNNKKTRYTVIVHYSTTEFYSADWDKFDI